MADFIFSATFNRCWWHILALLSALESLI